MVCIQGWYEEGDLKRIDFVEGTGVRKLDLYGNR